MRRAGRAAALLVVLSAVLAALGAGTAQAATGYRYWSYWTGSGTGWAYATQGPSQVRPDDGTVQGFRFSVSEDSQDSAEPRRSPDFAEICADTPAEDGTKRVALVIDPGTAADAPDGEAPPALRTTCARVAPDASAAEALASVAKPLRYDSSALLCAISGYPATGCGEQVADGGHQASGASATPSAAASAASTASTASDDSGGGPSVGVLAGVGAVLLLGVAAIVQARRRG
ncbi:SCO2322 family protein [Streptomyces sp. NPDC052052]|uniref:SCO2322 family protein n=1 Tax=Streptomyces sp. NPDC052052 TaxID=3154756 RepID=UPI003449E512